MAPEEPVAGSTTLIKPTELSIFHRNARRGDVAAIESSLRINSQYTPLVVNIGTYTGRPREVLVGNHTLMAVRNLAERDPFNSAWAKVRVYWLDVDDDKANRIVLVDNRSHDAGEGVDETVVWELIQTYGAEGTAFDDDDLAKLEVSLNTEPVEPPKPSLPGDKGIEAVISSTITFEDEQQQQTWFGFVKWLATQYPDLEMTLAERISAHLADTAADRAA